MNKNVLITMLAEMENENKAIVALYIHMPTGEIETIINPNIKAKREYSDAILPVS